MSAKTLESPLDCKEIKTVLPKGNQSWVCIGRTDAEAEAPILWPPELKNWLIGKDPNAGKDWRQEKKRSTEDEMVGWHHQLDGHEFELAPGVGDRQGSLACCSPWDCKELDMTEQLNWTEASMAHMLKNLPAMQQDPDSIPGSGRSPGDGNGNLLQYSCLENPMDRGAWRATVHGVLKSQTRLSNYTSTFKQEADFWGKIQEFILCILIFIFIYLFTIYSALHPIMWS